MIIALLALIGGFIALYLTLYKLGAIGELACSVGSCETVNASRYSRLLGAPVASWGLGAYAAILALALIGVRDGYEDSPAISWALVGLSGWSVLFSGWLTYLELFVIRAVCIWCMTSAALMTLIFVASVLDLRDVRGAG